MKKGTIVEGAESRVCFEQLDIIIDTWPCSFRLEANWQASRSHVLGRALVR